MRVVGEDGKETIARAHVYDETADAGPQDVVVLAVKAHQVAAIAPDLAALCNAEKAIVTMQNGIPWWYFHKHGGAHEGTPVRSADPDGSIARLIDANRVIDSVVYPAATLEAPGVVHVGLLTYPLTRQLSIDMMREAEAVAKKLGVFRVGIDKRIAGAEKVGEHKTSMLQDVEAGRAM
jgi:ketopantoate reductase